MSNVKAIKKIDIHCHAVLFREYFPTYYPEDPNSAFVSPEHVLEYHEKLGIDKGILLPIASPEGQLSPIPSEECKYITTKYPEHFYWFCNVDPRAEANTTTTDLCRLLRHYIALGAKGLGELTSHLDADDPQLDNLFSACEECDLPVIIHISPNHDDGYGICDEIGLPRLEKVLKKHPNLKIIGHSQPFWAEIDGGLTEEIRGTYPQGKVVEGGRLIELLRKYDNLYCDLSAGSGSNAMMRDPEFTQKFFEEFADRIMYGCDICLPGQTFPFKFRDFLDQMLDEGKLSEENYRKIARENAIRILKLDA